MKFGHKLFLFLTLVSDPKGISGPIKAFGNMNNRPSNYDCPAGNSKGPERAPLACFGLLQELHLCVPDLLSDARNWPVIAASIVSVSANLMTLSSPIATAPCGFRFVNRFTF